ncbi:amidohydrolase family protein [Gloeobacter kilaueensis]|uniref:Cytosine deaminase n=1 Tax=Gloeobacter kilaueensis (strain ATCC BAA-2537 / CCAP 1431/1 / ULC 316 / JS1) TaxID=1183438 RepID=U5QME7_GLOK1|nr:amidohydrolase family protein [Gloeobacter kilaueensis]AGY58784.1 cytosine deaminase [Gloeobacter kilaueensis JS1]
MIDLLIRQAALPGGGDLVDIAILGGRIVEVSPRIEAQAHRTIEAAGFLVSPPFIDSHFHMDSTLTFGQPRVNLSGTLLEGIALWGELQPQLTVESVKARALELCRWAIARGNLAIRSHVDICDPKLTALLALLEVRDQIKPYLDLQLVAFPQQGYLRYPDSLPLMQRALDLGVDVVGGIPHFERTAAEGAESVRLLCELAAERGLPVDMHCDESDDPHSRFVEYLAYQTTRLGLEGRVTGSHLTSMHSMDNYYASKLIDLMVEARLHVVANPLINITLQGRHDTYPKRRGVTRIRELQEAGLTVALGHDCVQDPWYPLGSHDLLEVAHMAVHVAQMTGIAQMGAMFEAITTAAARVLGLEHYGLTPGCWADMVILQARDPIEAIRLRPARLFVIRRGQVIARTPAVHSQVELGESTFTIDFLNADRRSCPSL